VKRHRAVALGADCRLESAGCIGFALTYCKKVLHLSVFVENNGSDEAPKPALRI
jgi:hypothetical protein